MHVLISYDTNNDVKIYNPKEQGNIAYQITNDIAKYVDLSYSVNKKIDVPIYKDNVTYKGNHETKTYKTRLSIPSVFEIFSADTSQLGVPYWLIDGSKEKENKTMIDRDGTTPFYYRKSGVEAGVKAKIYIDKNSYINSDYCQSGSCKIAK